jgi:hypothetical protein
LAGTAVSLLGLVVALSSLLAIAGEFTAEMVLPVALIAGALGTPFFVLALQAMPEQAKGEAERGPRSLCVATKAGLALTFLYWVPIVVSVAEDVSSSDVSLGLFILDSPALLTPLLLVFFRRHQRLNSEA